MICREYWSDTSCFLGGLHFNLKFGESLRVLVVPLEEKVKEISGFRL